MKFVINFFRKLLNIFTGNKSSRFIDSGNSTNVNGIIVEARTPVKDKKYLKIGESSLISGRFVFETPIGEVTIGNRTFIGSGNLFVCADRIQIGNDVMFSWGCTVIDNDAHSLNWNDRVNDVLDWKRGIEEGNPGAYKNWEVVNKKGVVIGDKCWIGFNSIILKGVTIGEGAVIAAGSVVTKDVEPFTLVAGNPAIFIKKLNTVA